MGPSRLIVGSGQTWTVLAERHAWNLQLGLMGRTVWVFAQIRGHVAATENAEQLGQISRVDQRIAPESEPPTAI